MEKPAKEKVRLTIYIRPSEAKRIRVAAVKADMTLSEYMTVAALKLARETAGDEGPGIPPTA